MISWRRPGGPGLRLLERMRYLKRAFLDRPRRYRALFRTLHARRCRTLLEIGTYDGVHAVQLIETAALFHRPASIVYDGFDLFEQLSAADLERELSKRPPARAEVERRLAATGARIRLHPGYTAETLPAFAGTARRRGYRPDLVFIDGGHSIETIASDWSAVERLMGENTVVLFDDYYRNDDPEIEGMGCQQIVDGLDPERFEVEVLDTVDEFEKAWGTLRISIVRVTRRRGRAAVGPDAADWSDLLAAPEEELERRLGRPESRRAAGDAVWLTFTAPVGRLRVRCAFDGSGTARVASWTVSFAEPPESLEAAARDVGLWPAAAPDAVASEVDAPLVRRVLPASRAGSGPCSLTATIRADRFDRLSVFDEAPDWL